MTNIDDFAKASSPDAADSAFMDLIYVLQDLLGLELAPDKLESPAEIMIFLGIFINTVNMTLSIPVEKLELARIELARWKERSHATKRQLQSLLGRLCHLATCVRPGRRFAARVIDAIKTQSFPVELDDEFKMDITWWQRFMNEYNGVSMIQSQPWTSLVSTDSSLVGCGGYFKGNFFHADHPPRINAQQLGITQLEILAVVIACKLCGQMLLRENVSVLCDNDAVCTVINSGRSRNEFLQAALRELWSLEARYQFNCEMYTHCFC